MDIGQFRPSTNVEDLRNDNLGKVLGYFGVPRVSDFVANVQYAYQHPFTPMSDPPVMSAEPGSLPDQAGVNQLDAMIKALRGNGK